MASFLLRIDNQCRGTHLIFNVQAGLLSVFMIFSLPHQIAQSISEFFYG